MMKYGHVTLFEHAMLFAIDTNLYKPDEVGWQPIKVKESIRDMIFPQCFKIRNINAYIKLLKKNVLLLKLKSL